MNVAALEIGNTVTYTDRKDHTKLGVVLGTPETIKGDSSLGTLDEGQVFIYIITPGTFSRGSGACYTRKVVLWEDGTFHNVEQPKPDARREAEPEVRAADEDTLNADED